jgi:isocitrate lyase
LESPYRTPQTHVGGPRLDSALAASSGRTATTKAMGKGSTQFQHLVQTELPIAVLDQWVGLWSDHYGVDTLHGQLKPHKPGSTVMELSLWTENDKLANVVFTAVVDRNQRKILTINDQNTFSASLRKKRLMTLMHLFLLNRFKVHTVHYLTPTEDNTRQCEAMAKLDIYQKATEEIGQIIVAEVNIPRVKSFVEGQTALMALIRKEDKSLETA